MGSGRVAPWSLRLCTEKKGEQSPSNSGRFTAGERDPRLTIG